jgi:hypothetical protein
MNRHIRNWLASSTKGAAFTPSQHQKPKGLKIMKKPNVFLAALFCGLFAAGSTAQAAPASIANGRYVLLNANSGNVLAVSGGSTANGGNVVQSEYDALTYEQWDVTGVGSGKYKITNANSGKALDVQGGSRTNGTNIQQWSYIGVSGQQWTFEDRGNGYYSLHPSSNSGSCADVQGASKADGANVLQWPYGGAANQQWALVNTSTIIGRSVTLNPGDDIQRALYLYDTVTLNAGTYTLTNSLFFTSGKTLQGSGNRASILTRNGTFGMLKSARWPDAYISDVTIQNLTLDGALKAEMGINIGMTVRLKIDSVTAYDTLGMALSNGAANDGTFTNLTIDRCGNLANNWHSIYDRGNNNCTYSNIVVTNSDGVGVKLSEMHGILIQNVSVTASRYAGFAMQGENANITFRQCTANNNGGEGFIVFANGGTTIDNCIANNNYHFGYTVNTNDDSTPYPMIMNSTGSGNTWFTFDIHGHWGWDGYGANVSR